MGVGAVSGCSFTPVNFSGETPTPSSSDVVDPSTTVDPEFFVRVGDQGAKFLFEGAEIGQRFSTPHLDGMLVELFVGESLSLASAEQVGQRSPIRAPDGHELAAFTLQSGVPGFVGGVGHEASALLRVGDRRIPLPMLFDEFIPQDGAHLSPWEMVCLCLPTGSDVILEVTDEGKVISLDLRTGKPEPGDGWDATTGFRERWSITCDPATGLYSRAFTTVPPDGVEPETGQLSIGLRPDTGDGLRPWTPAQGWAPPSQQWLEIGMDAKVQWEARIIPQFTLSVPESFFHADQGGEQVAAVQPDSITTDAISTGQADLVVVWAVTATGGPTTISFTAVGAMTVDYADVGSVPARFSADAPPIEFTLRHEPIQR